MPQVGAGSATGEVGAGLPGLIPAGKVSYTWVLGSGALACMLAAVLAGCVCVAGHGMLQGRPAGRQADRQAGRQADNSSST